MDNKENGDLVEFGASLSHYSEAQNFFRRAFSEGHYNITKKSIYTKLQEILNTGTFAEMTCGRSTIDLEKSVNERKVILFNLSKGSIGEDEGRAFGRLVIAMLQGIALRRESIPKSKRVPVHLVIDECHNCAPSAPMGQIELIALERVSGSS